MSVDFSTLASRLGFDERYVEKACRVSDLIRRISQVPFLRDRLTLYGGTALAFVHFPEISRLSIDIDFNYRHLDAVDWGIVRESIDGDLKQLLYAMRYRESDLFIDASYPLGRITVNYQSQSGSQDNFKVEVGYMRRIPVLSSDILSNYRHPTGGEAFKILTPQREELFANKWCTMLYRGSSRDLFDVSRIAEQSFNMDIFRTCAVVDSLMRGQPKLNEIDSGEIIDQIPVDSGLLNLLKREIRDFSPAEARRKAKSFSNEIISSLTKDHRNAINKFQDEHRFHPELIDKNGVLNPRIKTHPMILRALQEQK
ncbi:nucleotidyl transferase AbiEii/AbiGii toxin family protein [Candidatus Bathyarchaeota archaeon]|nr:nucleotidyl transferase AbiEii/AbiGii toxin family protein [Candidatus Bathyarchaeota archaeon]